MVSPTDDSKPTTNKLQAKLTQDRIVQTKPKLSGLFHVSAQERLERWQKTPVRLDNWSGTLESEIYHALW